MGALVAVIAMLLAVAPAAAGETTHTYSVT
jgi:hypothetical protein